MVGDIKAISPCVKSASAKLFLDLHTVSAPSGEERTRRFDSGTHAWCGHATVMVLVSSASGPRVSGCTRAPRYFHPYGFTPYSVHPHVCDGASLEFSNAAKKEEVCTVP